MTALIIGAILGSALTIVVGVLLAGYHLRRRRGDEAEWRLIPRDDCDPGCECQR